MKNIVYSSILVLILTFFSYSPLKAVFLYENPDPICTSTFNPTIKENDYIPNILVTLTNCTPPLGWYGYTVSKEGSPDLVKQSVFIVRQGTASVRINTSLLDAGNYILNIYYGEYLVSTYTFTQTEILINHTTILKCGTGGIATAIGCFPAYSDVNAFTLFILRWSLGVGGGIVIFTLTYAGFLIITAHGDQAKLQSAKEAVTAALSGIIYLIFSIFILQLIGRALINYGPFI